MTDTTTTDHGRRLRDLEAAAFRTGRALTGPGESTATTGQRRDTAPGSVEERLDTIERLPLALARAQGIDPTAPD